MTQLRVRSGFKVRALPDGDAVVANEGDADAVIVNSTAHAIIDMLADELSEERVVEVFCESFPDQDPSAIRGDIAAVVEQLVQAGVLERT